VIQERTFQEMDTAGPFSVDNGQCTVFTIGQGGEGDVATSPFSPGWKTKRMQELETVCIVKSSLGRKNPKLSLSCSVYTSADGRAGVKGMFEHVIEKCDNNPLKMGSTKTMFSIFLFDTL
jgi:hypothetical protein